MVFSLIGNFARNHPFKFGCAFSCTKTSFSDWLVQTQIEKREHIDWKRNSAFASFGLFYLGGVQYAIYVPIFSRLFPGAAAYARAPLSAKLADGAGTRNLVSQVFLDQFVHHPLMYFPAFYCLKEVVTGDPKLDATTKIETGLSKYSKNYKEDLVALWKIWVPSTFINFAFMPMYARIPWVASTSLIWTCILSAMRGDSDMETSPEKAMDYIGSQGKSLVALYDLGTAAKPAYLYDSSKAHVLFTATGRDKVGFIGQLSNAVAQHSGNVLDIKAYKVGREFVTIMLVETPPGNVRGMEKSMKKCASEGIVVTAQHTQPWMAPDFSPRCKDGVHYTGYLRAQGTDQPGLILKLTALLAELELDIASLSCNQHWQTSLSKEHELQQLFQISGVVRSFDPKFDRAALTKKLVAFENELPGVRMGITETDSDPSFSAFASNQSKGERRSLVRTLSGKPPPA